MKEEGENWQHLLTQKSCTWRNETFWHWILDVQIGNNMYYKMKNKGLFKTACPIPS